MKLKNKILLPILTVGAAAAAATPLLVSCGASNGSSVYIPTIPKAIPQSGHGSYDESEVQAIYYQHVKENPEVYAQDLKCHLSSFEERLNLALSAIVFSETMRSGTPIEHKFNIGFNFNYTLSNLEFGEYTQINSNIYAIPTTMDINCSLHIDAKDDAPYIYMLQDAMSSGSNAQDWTETTFAYQYVNLSGIKLHFINYPLMISEYSSTSLSGMITGGGWVVESVLENVSSRISSDILPWSLTMSVDSGACTCTWQANKNMSFDNFHYVFDNNSTMSEIQNDMKLYWSYMMFGYVLFVMSSYHMSDFKYGQP